MLQIEYVFVYYIGVAKKVRLQLTVHFKLFYRIIL